MPDLNILGMDKLRLYDNENSELGNEICNNDMQGLVLIIITIINLMELYSLNKKHKWVHIYIIEVCLLITNVKLFSNILFYKLVFVLFNKIAYIFF